jgi:virginiamycin A acetyltransferase
MVERALAKIPVFKKYLFRKKGLYTSFPQAVSSDISIEPPVFTGNVIISRNCHIGKHTYICSGTLWENVSIGRYCSIADNALIGPPDHPTHFLTTKDSFYFEKDYYKEWLKDKNTILGNDIWLGANILIRKGVKIGDGAVVAAGAVVTENVPPYAIVGGIPAKIIKYRFDQNTINFLLQIKWWNFDEATIRGLPFNNVNECIEILSKKKTLN